MADRLHQMRLAETDVAVDEQGIVHLTGRFGNGKRCGMREHVAVADDEIVEGVFRIQA